MMGYSISLAVSVSKLTTDRIQIVRVIYFKILPLSGNELLQFILKLSDLGKKNYGNDASADKGYACPAQ